MSMFHYVVAVEYLEIVQWHRAGEMPYLYAIYIPDKHWCSELQAYFCAQIYPTGCEFCTYFIRIEVNLIFFSSKITVLISHIRKLNYLLTRDRFIPVTVEVYPSRSEVSALSLPAAGAHSARSSPRRQTFEARIGFLAEAVSEAVSQAVRARRGRRRRTLRVA